MVQKPVCFAEEDGLDLAGLLPDLTLVFRKCSRAAEDETPRGILERQTCPRSVPSLGESPEFGSAFGRV